MSSGNPQSRDAGGRAPIGVAVLCAALAVGAIVLNQSAVHWRSDLGDEHLFAYYGWLITQGARPYLDLWDNKPPGIFWASAIAMCIDAPGSGGLIVVCGAALALAIAAFIDTARSLFGRAQLFTAAVAGSAMLTQLRYECGGDRTETFVVALELVAVCAYLRGLRTARTGWFVLSAFAVGGAPLFKQAGLAAGAACAAHYAWSRFAIRCRGTPRISPRAAACIGVAAVTPIVCAAAALSAPGQWSAAWYAVVSFNRAYFAVGDASWTNLGGALGVYAPALHPLFIPAALAAVGVLLSISSALRRPPPDEQPRLHTHCGVANADALLVIWLALAFYLALVSPGRREYHLMPLLAPLGLLALAPLARLLGNAPVRRMLARPSFVGAVLIWGLLMASPAADTLAIAQQCWSGKQSWYSLQSTHVDDDTLRAARIRELCRADETIYVLGWSPGTYRLALRRCPSRFSTTEKTGQVGQYADFILKTVAHDLRTSPPKLIFISDTDLNKPPVGILAEISAWLTDNYARAEVVGGMRMFIRRADATR